MIWATQVVFNRIVFFNVNIIHHILFKMITLVSGCCYCCMDFACNLRLGSPKLPFSENRFFFNALDVQIAMVFVKIIRIQRIKLHDFSNSTTDFYSHLFSLNKPWLDWRPSCLPFNFFDWESMFFHTALHMLATPQTEKLHEYVIWNIWYTFLH